MKPGKLNRTARLTLFSTAIITVVMFFLQLLLLDSANPDAPHWAALLALPATALIAYVVSALVIDRAMNPIRLMIERVREIGNMNFAKPLVVYDEGEDVREYAEAFNNMAHRLNDYIERQKRFISDASHELATPLTAINGHADLLLRRMEMMETTAPRLATSLTAIKTEALRMSDLVDSLLMLARSDAGKQSYRFAKVDVTRLCEEALEEARHIARGSFAQGDAVEVRASRDNTLRDNASLCDVAIVFEADFAPPLTALADENALRRVVRILLVNAIKHAPASAENATPAASHEPLRITLSARAEGGLLHISVRDTGVGIAPQHLPRIFERFYRADPARAQKNAAQNAAPQSTASSGLGLAIAREIITAHGGEIHAQSQPNQGTTLTFFIKSS